MASLALVASCSVATPDPSHDGELRIVTTTGILADFVRNVVGSRGQVSQLIPDGADPHSYEPSLRAIRDVAWADMAFSNYLMLEQHSIIRALDANLPAGAQSVSIAEEAAKNGATILPLVENRGLDALWLGLRVAGDGRQFGATRSSTVRLAATGMEGPGTAAAFITTTFGAPEVAFSSHDGLAGSQGEEEDAAMLPAAAHQHMSWGFSKPGIYRLRLAATLAVGMGKTVEIPPATLVFAVGVDAAAIAAREGRLVIGAGHGDVTVDLNARAITLMLDKESVPEGAPVLGGEGSASNHTAGQTSEKAGQQAEAEADALQPATVQGLASLSLDDVILEVPPRTQTQVPGGAGYRFLGHAGDPMYLLPQAVLGKHVHGDIDPHLWHDVHNAAAYVRVIRDKLAALDPAGAQQYRANAAAYLDRLERLDSLMQEQIHSIPQSRRHLVTTNDAYAYLANAYGLDIAGFVAPHPGVEPSLADRKKLSATLASLHVPAVFLEPYLNQRRSTLVSVAKQAGVGVCPLYGDTLDAQAPTYIDMMQFNARSLARCLSE